MIKLSTQDEHLRPSLYVDTRGYVRISPSGELLHRRILGHPQNLCGDHVNGDKLDNRRENLRACTRKENNRNRGLHSNSATGVKNVYFDRVRSKYRPYITCNGRRRWLGSFDTAEQAAQVYAVVSRELFGEFARSQS